MNSNQMNRTFLWSLFILIVLGGIIFVSSRAAQAPQTGGEVREIEINEGDRIKGDENAPLTLVEYSDFQCPACAHYYPLVRDIIEEFSGDVRLVYRHFPLPQHANAELAARASEAAGNQGKFYEMHDLIFIEQSTWSRQSSNQARVEFISYAAELELNLEQFENDLDSNSIIQKVRDDQRSGVALGVTGTPTFFLNGQKITNPRSLDEFRNLIQSKLESLNIDREIEIQDNELIEGETVSDE